MMRFGDAVRWCLEHHAVWRFAPAEKPRQGFVLSLDTGAERVEITGRDATDWGWMLIRAVERVVDARQITERPDPGRSLVASFDWDDTQD